MTTTLRANGKTAYNGEVKQRCNEIKDFAKKQNQQLKTTVEKQIFAKETQAKLDECSKKVLTYKGTAEEARNFVLKETNLGTPKKISRKTFSDGRYLEGSDFHSLPFPEKFREKLNTFYSDLYDENIDTSVKQKIQLYLYKKYFNKNKKDITGSGFVSSKGEIGLKKNDKGFTEINEFGGFYSRYFFRENYNLPTKNFTLTFKGKKLRVNKKQIGELFDEYTSLGYFR